MSDVSASLRDPARLDALRATGLLDSAPEPAFDRLTRMASRLLGVPVALVSLVEDDRQFFKSAHGLPLPWAETRQTPLSHSFCQHVVASGSPLVVEDAREHSLVRSNLAIPELGVVAYAGVPLASPDGRVLGAFCAIDGQPRAWTAAELETLADVAASAAAEIGLRAARAAAEDTAARMKAVATAAAAMIGARDAVGVCAALREACRRAIPFDAFTFALLEEEEGADAALDFLEAVDEGQTVARLRVPLAGTPSERVVRERRSVRVSHAGDPAAAGHTVRMGTGRRSESTVRTPILAGDRVLGVLSVQSYAPGAYQAADVEVLEAVAALAATALLNVRARAGRAAAEAALDESEARYRALVDRLPVGVYRTTPEGEILDANPALAEMLGFSGREALLAGNVLDFVDPALRGRWRERIDRDGVVRDVDVRNHRGDGREVWLRDNARALRGPGGEVLCYEGVLEDVTEEKRAEEALRRTSAYFRALTESSSDVTCVLDGASSIRYLSPSTLRVLGYDPEASLETELLEVVHEEDLPAVVETLTSLLREPGGSRVLEMRVRHAGGQWRTLEALARNLLHDPVVAGVVVNARDVTERRRAEAGLRAAREELERRVRERTAQLDRASAALRESEEHFRALIENASDVTAVVGGDGTVRYESPSVSRVLGYAPQELLGRELRAYVHPEDLARVDEAFEAIAAEAGSTARVRARLRTTAGEWRLLEVFAKNLLDVAAVGGVVLNARDVTDRARMEEALRQSERDHRGLFENAHDAILILDPEDERVLEANPRACQMYGFAREDFLGRSISQFSRDAEQGRRRLRETLGRPAPHQFETVQLRSTGEEMHLEVNAAEVEYRRRPAILSINRDITPRRRVEEALRESEAQLRAIFDATAAGIALVDRGGRPIETNRALREMLGFSAGELRGRTLRDLAHPGDAAGDDAPFAGLMEGERGHYHAEKRFLRRDGSVLWGHLTVSAVRDDRTGEPLYAIAVVDDVTERRAAEEALRQRDQQLAQAQSIAHVGSYVAEPATGRVTWSDEMFRIFGYEPQSFVPGWGSYLEHVHPGDRALVMRGRESDDHGPGEHPGTREHRIVRPDGEVRVLHTRRERMGTPGAPGYRIIGTAQDVTERRAAEEARRDSEERFRQLAENIREVFYMNERPSGRVLYVSPAYEEVWGRSRGSLQDAPASWKEGLHPDDRERVERDRAAAGGEPHDLEYRIVRPGGETRWIRDRSFPVRDAAGRVYREAGLAEDVTERKRLEAELRQSQKMEAVGRLAGGIAHDFNNLLMSIMAHTYVLLRDGEVGEAARWSAAEIQGATERAAGLTRQLLAFSRKQVLQPTVLDLNEVVAGMSGLLRRLIGEDVELRTELDPALGRVRADRGQLEQVVLNLAVNARDAMPAGGRLALSTRAERTPRDQLRDGAAVPAGSYAVLAVADTGVGMDGETRGRVFEPFFTTKEMGKGTGLGLSTVYGIVKQSGGWVWVESEPGEGAVFEVWLPLARDPGAAPAPAAPREEAPPSPASGTLLLVEDDDAVRRPLRRILERSGFTVVEAADGVEGLSAATAPDAAIDVVLCDVVMPRMGGREMMIRLGVERPELPVILMSGYTDEAVTGEGGPGPGARFIQKPVAPDELVRRVREVLEECEGAKKC